MTAPAAANQPPNKRRPRRQNLAAVGEVFGDFTPWRNPAAVYSYRVSLYGLTPLAGLLLGPIAIALGVVGRIKSRQPEVYGKNFATAGIVIGTIDLVFNLAGTACLARGLGWW